MAPTAFVTVEEYLKTKYEPGCEYVDGELQERHQGEWDHGRLQIGLGSHLCEVEKHPGYMAYMSLRLEITPSRFRVPDLCVAFGQQPFLCIEIISRDDRLTNVREKVRDYKKIGVKFIWVVDPRTRIADIYSPWGIHEATDGVLTTKDPDITISLSDVYRSLD